MPLDVPPSGPPIVVTRHPALVALLVERGLIPPDAPVIPHATEADVRGRAVIGVLPLRLAVLAYSVTEVPLDLGPEDRGVELPLERLREIAGPAVTYYVASAGAPSGTVSRWESSVGVWVRRAPGRGVVASVSRAWDGIWRGYVEGDPCPLCGSEDALRAESPHTGTALLGVVRAIDAELRARGYKVRGLGEPPGYGAPGS